MDNIAICLSSDNNYVQHLGATISSVLRNKNINDFINIYIIDGGISEENKSKLNLFESGYDCKVIYLKPNLDTLKNCTTFKGDYISIATYYRLLIPELIPNEDKVIYLDCDIIVRSSLKELYNLNFNKNLALGVVDVSAENHSKRLNISKYVNAGVLLLNNKQMREENSVKMIFDWIENNQEKIECHDQDVINASLAGRIEYIDVKFNAQVRRKNLSYFDNIEEPVILHFISPKKPWTLYKPLNSTKWAYEYFKALEGTPWENFIKEYKKNKLLYFIPNLLYPTGILKDFIRNIFSVKNSDDRQFKIITILGIQIKRKKINKKQNDVTVKILVGYHKKDRIYKNKFLIPIHLGKNIAYTKSKDGLLTQSEYQWLDKNMIGDNTGENISDKNRFLNEMTGIYWVWKNYDKIGNPNYIGFNHYKRYFKLNYSNLNKILNKHELVYLGKPAFEEGVYNQWKQSFSYGNFEENGLDKLIILYKELYAEDFDNFIRYIHQPNKGGFMNLFIMKKEDFFSYCEWIFSILSALENNVSKENRTIGMLAERLTSYYLYKLDNKKAIKTTLSEVPPALSFLYIISQIFSIQKKIKTSKDVHLQIIIMGIKFSIKMNNKENGEVQ